MEPEVAGVQGFHGEEQTPSIKTSHRGLSAVRLVQAQQEIEFVELNAQFLQDFDHVLYW